MYSSHYNERDSNEGETSVCFTMVVLLQMFLAKPLCRCVQYAISSDGWDSNINIRIFKRKAFTVVQCLDFEDRLILTVFRIRVAGQSGYKRIFS